MSCQQTNYFPDITKGNTFTGRKMSFYNGKGDSKTPMDLTGVALEATSQDILTAVNNIDVDFTPVLDAVDLTLKAADYLAPDNATIAEIQTKVDTLENTDLTGIATTTDVTTAKDNILTAINDIPETDLTGIATSSEVQAVKDVVDELPIDRLKQVATVETTGEQLSSFNNV